MTLSLTLLGLGLDACTFVDEIGESVQNDGEYCASDADCSTENCTTARLCGHSRCSCSGATCPPEGEAVAACRPGWVCTDASSLLDPVQEFFGGTPAENKGYCHPSCEGGCPEHYFCDRSLCLPDSNWLDPHLELRWTGAVEGSTSVESTVQLEEYGEVAVTAVVTSELDISLQPVQWTLVDGSTGERVKRLGDTVAVNLGEARFLRVEVLACDTELHCSILHLVFESCRGAGTPCGYQGSGCCGSCDEENSICSP